MSDLPEKLFLFWSRSTGQYRSFCSELSASGWTVLIIQSAASLSRLGSRAGQPCCLAILDPTGQFSQDDLDEIARFISRGNSSLVAVSSNDDNNVTLLSANIGDLTRLYGVELNNDCVIRPNLYKLFHPKEAMLEDFIANRGLGDILKRHIKHKPSDDSLSRPQGGPVKFGPRIIYPRGRTLKVHKGGAKQSTIMMTSSGRALPGGQPICAFYRDDKLNSNVIILGSAHLMSDAYLDKEDNRSLVIGCFLDFLASSNEKSFPINISDARTIEMAESNMTPDMGKLMQLPFGSLQELEPLPERMTDLIDAKLFQLDNSKLPLLLGAYRDLGVAYEPLTLMRPLFEWPPGPPAVDDDATAPGRRKLVDFIKRARRQ